MLPTQYQWLTTIAPPKVIAEALQLYGTLEKIGPASNPVILEWASEVGLSKTYTGDDIPWCGLFVATVVNRAGYEVVDKPLWARSWLDYGINAQVPSLGDVLVFSRDGGGHVAFYVAEDAMCYHVMGGNQSDSVSITRVNKTRLLGARRSKWKIAQPASVKPYKIGANGVVSTNEA